MGWRPRWSPRPPCWWVRRWRRPTAPRMRWRGGSAPEMTTDQFFWVLARVAGLSSYAALATTMVTGIALRTAGLDWLGRNRARRSLPDDTTVLSVPLPVPPLR